ncbi:hypothetical protein AADZ84_06930 [Colwelliaceae bacterium MEBiC 14330]
MAKSINPLDASMTKTLSNQNNQTHKSRRSFLLLLSVFILPVILAKLALEKEWLNTAVTNQGTLLTQPFTLNDLGLSDEGLNNQWLIIYRLPDICNKLCLESIEIVHNSYVVLGKDMPRVTPVLLTKNIFSAEQSKQLSKSQWQRVQLTPQMNHLLITPQILIADPLGNIILSHQHPEQAQQQALLGKAIIADMKKLLKYSKVG